MSRTTKLLVHKFVGCHHAVPIKITQTRFWLNRNLWRCDLHGTITYRRKRLKGIAGTVCIFWIEFDSEADKALYMLTYT